MNKDQNIQQTLYNRGMLILQTSFDIHMALIKKETANTGL